MDPVTDVPATEPKPLNFPQPLHRRVGKEQEQPLRAPTCHDGYEDIHVRLYQVFKHRYYAPFL